MLPSATFATIKGEEMSVEIVGEDESVKAAMEQARSQAEFIAAQRYSDAEKVKFARLIREFNALYYQLDKQTWSNTRYRGVTLFKAPTDLWIYQELIEACRPDLIIETGTCRGGSALFLHDTAKNICPCTVISIDTTHDFLHGRAKESDVVFLLGSSTDDEIVARVKAHIAAYYCQRVMVILDSDHSKEHVLKELQIYAPLVSVHCPLIVEDTNNCNGPKDAIDEWLSEHEQHTYQFRPDYMCEKFMLTFNRDGYFERIK